MLSKCGQSPRKIVEKFNSLKLHVKQSTVPLSLCSLTKDYYAESGNMVDMRCSNCPFGENKPVTCSNTILNSPEFLLVVLLKFPYFDGTKVTTVVIPEMQLVLPNGDKFELISVCNHLGDFISAGHYTTSVKENNMWMQCDDDKITQIRNVMVSNKHNYVLLYKKIPKNCQLESNQNDDNSRRDRITRKEDPVIVKNSKSKAKGKDEKKLECPGCRKEIVNIMLHLKRSTNCQAFFNMKEMEENLQNLKREKEATKKRKWRQSRDETKRETERLQDNVRKKVQRKNRDEVTREAECLQDKIRKKVYR